MVIPYSKWNDHSPKLVVDDSICSEIVVFSAMQTLE